MRKRKSRVAAARAKAEGAHLAALWDPIEAEMDEELRAWWAGGGPPVHLDTARWSTLENAQVTENIRWSNLSTVATLETHFGENPSDTPHASAHGSPHAHTRPSNVVGPVGPVGPNQQRRAFEAVHPRSGGVDKVDPGDWAGEYEPAEPHPTRAACEHCGGRINWQSDGVAFADNSVAHIACYEQAAARGPRW